MVLQNNKSFGVSGYSYFIGQSTYTYWRAFKQIIWFTGMLLYSTSTDGAHKRKNIFIFEYSTEN